MGGQCRDQDEPGSDRKGLVPRQSMHKAISTACRLLDGSGVASGLRYIGPLPLSYNEDLKAAMESEIAAGQEQIDQKNAESADTDEKNAQAKEDLEDTRKSFLRI